MIVMFVIEKVLMALFINKNIFDNQLIHLYLILQY